MVIIFERSYELHTKWEIHHLTNCLLLFQVFLQILLYNLALFHTFQSIQLLIIFRFHQIDISELTLSQFLKHYQIAQMNIQVSIYLFILHFLHLNFMRVLSILLYHIFQFPTNTFHQIFQMKFINQSISTHQYIFIKCFVPITFDKETIMETLSFTSNHSTIVTSNNRTILADH